MDPWHETRFDEIRLLLNTLPNYHDVNGVLQRIRKIESFQEECNTALNSLKDESNQAARYDIVLGLKHRCAWGGGGQIPQHTPLQASIFFC